MLKKIIDIFLRKKKIFLLMYYIRFLFIFNIQKIYFFKL